MKFTDVEWLGKVPEHWDVVRGAAILEEQRRKNDGLVSDNYLSLMANRGIIPYAEKGAVGNKKPEDLTKCKIVEVGDFVLNSMNYAIGSYGVSAYDGVVSPVYVVMKHRPELVEPKFVDLILSNSSYQNYAQSLGTGILDHRRAIGWDEIKAIRVPLPPIDEQRIIALWTHRKTTRIDAMVAKKTRFIELLREKRLAVITHAVTKGLEPSVPMKESGVESLGSTPEDWEVTKTRFITTKIGSGKTPNGGAMTYVTQGVPFLRSQNVHDDGLRLDDVVFISAETHREMRVSRVHSGDVLLNITGASIGRSCIAPADLGEANVNQHVCIVRCTDQSASEWVRWVFCSAVIKAQVDQLQTGAGREGLNFEQVAEFRLAVPSRAEREKVCVYLDRVTSKIDTLIAKTERSIELLREHRTALITAAVTGKIDPRSAA